MIHFIAPLTLRARSELYTAGYLHIAGHSENGYIPHNETCAEFYGKTC